MSFQQEYSKPSGQALGMRKEIKSSEHVPISRANFY